MITKTQLKTDCVFLLRQKLKRVNLENKEGPVLYFRHGTQTITPCTM